MKKLEDFAKNLLSRYGYSNWDIVWDSKMPHAGRTSYATNTIFISTLVFTVSEEIQKDIIIHEIAHVRAGQFIEAHGSHWEKLAVAMGGTGKIKV